MKSLFRKYIRSVLSPEEFESFCNYIAKSENTDEINSQMDLIWEDQSEDEILERKNPTLFQNIQKAIMLEEFKAASKKLRLYSIGTRFAAVLVFGLLITSIWLYIDNGSSGEQLTQTVSIPYGAKTQLTMPDGSVVWLNSGSTISYSNNFRKREVTLTGEAYFDVVKSKNQFTVNTQYGSVEVLGTAFNVQAYDDNEFLTTLERGSVRVANLKGAKYAVLKPGEQLKVFDNKIIKSAVNTAEFTSWKDGKLIFTREPFPNTMKRLERWFNVKIDCSTVDFNDLWFSGIIENESILEVMDIICKTAPVKYQYNSQNRSIKIESKNN